MIEVKNENLEKCLKGMENHISQIKNMNQEELTEALIYIGVLDKEGNPKEQICTGKYYG